MFKLGLPPPPSRPRTPVPKFKYIDDPVSIGRNYAHRQIPFAGDFCVMSIDHVASVAYLGPKAMKAAKRIPSKRYIGYVGMPLAIPYEGNTTNPFALSLVSPSVPATSAYCDDTPACIPINPNTECYGGRQPVEACAPFPYPECYISTFTTKNFRVTTAKRDYSPVLCLPSDRSAANVYGTISKDSFSRGDFYRRRRLGDTEALARMPFSPSPEPSSDPLAFLPPPSESSVSYNDGTAGSEGPTDASRPTFPSKSLDELTSTSAVNTMLASAMFGGGSNHWPVVNIWYDLDMISEVRDPELCMQECDMLDQLRWHFEDLKDDEGIQSPSTPVPSSGFRPPSASPPPAPSKAAGTRDDATEVVPIPSTLVPDIATAAVVEDGSSSRTDAAVDAETSHSISNTATDASPATPPAEARPPSPSSVDVPQISVRAQKDNTQRRRIFAAWAPETASNASASGTSTPSQPARSPSPRGAHRSTSRTSLRSLKDTSSSSASPTKREFPKHPHPYAIDRLTRSASTISYAVPRPRHDSLKSLKKSRSGSSLKAPRRAATLSVTRSLK
ncbi:hypothetical protein PENSPDRAFT_760214 [Peniophora sp. CONT]|nr:hypothetical protein PENSPDRAFT_760214 [Peniophora sp. CONT]